MYELGLRWMLVGAGLGILLAGTVYRYVVIFAEYTTFNISSRLQWFYT